MTNVTLCPQGLSKDSTVICPYCFAHNTSPRLIKKLTPSSKDNQIQMYHITWRCSRCTNDSRLYFVGTKAPVGGTNNRMDY